MKRIKGFTLYETLIVAVLFSLIFGVTFEILVRTQRFGDIGANQQEAQIQLFLGMENLVQELFDSTSTRIDPEVPFTDSPAITFQIPVGYDGTGAIIWGAKDQGIAYADHKIRYSVDGQQQLIRERLNASDTVQSTRILAHFVSGLTFSVPPPLPAPQNNNTLGITLTITRPAQGSAPAVTQSMSTIVTFRN